MSKPITIALVGETEAGSAEVQLARDNQLKATNWGPQTQKKRVWEPLSSGWQLCTCHPILRVAKTIQSFVMP